MGVAACPKLSLQLLQSHGTQEHKPPGLQSQVMEGHSLCGSLKNWVTRYTNWGPKWCVKDFPWEIMAIRSNERDRAWRCHPLAGGKQRGECKDSGCHKKGIKRKERKKKKNDGRGREKEKRGIKRKKKVVPTSFSKTEGEQEDGAHRPPSWESIPAGPSPLDQCFKIRKWVFSTGSLGTFQSAASVLGPGEGESTRFPFKKTS